MLLAAGFVLGSAGSLEAQILYAGGAFYHSLSRSMGGGLELGLQFPWEGRVGLRAFSVRIQSAETPALGVMIAAPVGSVVGKRLAADGGVALTFERNVQGTRVTRPALFGGVLLSLINQGIAELAIGPRLVANSRGSAFFVALEGRVRFGNARR